jgi:hypothetical protein
MDYEIKESNERSLSTLACGDCFVVREDDDSLGSVTFMLTLIHPDSFVVMRLNDGKTYQWPDQTVITLEVEAISKAEGAL